MSIAAAAKAVITHTKHEPNVTWMSNVLKTRLTVFQAQGLFFLIVPREKSRAFDCDYRKVPLESCLFSFFHFRTTFVEETAAGTELATHVRARFII